MIDLDEINKISHDKIADIVKSKFITIYNQKYDPNCPKDEISTGGLGLSFFEEQKAYFNSELNESSFKEQLSKATGLSVMNAFMMLAICGLSLQKGLTTDCYLMGKSKCIGASPNGAKVYGFFAVIDITGYGEVTMRKRSGQILGIENPVIVYDCDDFRTGERNGHKFVDYEKCMHRPNGALIECCYLKILKKDDYDYFVLDMEGMARLRAYNIKQNGGKYANALYGSYDKGWQPDTGFMIAKTIRHAFKGYPRLTIGDGAVLHADTDTISEQVSEQEVAPDKGVKVETDENDPF